MNRHSIYFSMVTLVIVIFLPVTGNAESDEWFLMARHGECVKIKSLERKIPNLEGIDTPVSFEKLMRERGFKIQITEMPDIKGFLVEVPEKELSLLFVKRPSCKEFVDRKKRGTE